MCFVLLCGSFLVACEQPTIPEDEPQKDQFVDVTEAAGISFVHYTGAFGKKYFPEMAGGGGGFFDYNGDGWEDILLINGRDWPSHPGQTPTPALFENLQDGTFRDVTEQVGLDISIYGMGFAAADYDNDGDQDLIITAVGRNFFFRNDNGRFIDVSEEVGVSEEKWSSSPMFFDYDSDGWLDLFIANYVEWTEETDLYCSLDGENKAYCTPEIYTGEPSTLYRNKADGTFEDVSESTGIAAHRGKSLGVSLLDFNEDGWMDFAVANDTDPDFLFRNNGDGTFAEVGLPAGLALDEGGKARAGMGIDVGFVDKTGEETIFIGNFSNEMIGVYRDLGNGSYLDRAAVSQIGRTSLLYLTFGLFLFDYDLDADLDLFVANGHVQPEVEDIQQAVTFKQRPLLFENDGDGRFSEVGLERGRVFGIPVVGRGAGYADYDRDGDLDVLLSVGGDQPVLMRNDLKAKSAIRVRLEGRQSNRDALGALVEVKVGDGWLKQRVKTGSSYLAQSTRLLSFGTTGHNKVDSLIVNWPSGHVDVFKDVGADVEVYLVERAIQPSIKSIREDS